MGSSVIKDLGPAVIVWDPDGDNLELQPTFGTVTLKDELLGADIKEDGSGESPVDTVTTGRNVSLEVPMTRSTIDQLLTVIHGSEKDAFNNLLVKNSVGEAVYTNAKKIIIKPMVNGVADSDTSTWVVIFKAYPFIKAELGWDNSAQRVWLVEFKVYPDSSNQFYQYGNATT